MDMVHTTTGQQIDLLGLGLGLDLGVERRRRLERLCGRARL
jgi:hypothetical protein